MLHEDGGNCLKYLKRGWNRKEGKGNKDFKKVEGQTWSRGGCLKKGVGAGTPLGTMTSSGCIKHLLISRNFQNNL